MFGRNADTQRMSDTQKVVHNFCTPARVEKKALELIDEGKYANDEGFVIGSSL